MFLTGTLDMEQRINAAPELDPSAATELVLPGVEFLHVLWEIDDGEIVSVLPPGVHPSIPPSITWILLRCPESPVGPFCLALTRLTCRITVKPRGFVSRAYVDSPEAATLLSRWGFDAGIATVSMRPAYDMVTASVTAPSDGVILDLALVDPAVYDGEVFVSISLNLVRTPDGPRLVDVPLKMDYQRTDRGRPRVNAFDPAAWGEPRLVLTDPVAGFLGRGDLKLSPISESYDPRRTEFPW